MVLFVFAMNDGNQCLSNPLVYGVNKATSEDTGKLSCSCNFQNPKYQTLYFDEEKMSISNPLYDDSIFES